MTNQKYSGRCWIFAALNVIRLPFVKQYNLEDFEFSQAYLFFWDKIERTNFFLNNVVETAKRNEPVEGRLLSFLLNVSVTKIYPWECNIFKESMCFVRAFITGCQWLNQQVTYQLVLVLSVCK